LNSRCKAAATKKPTIFRLTLQMSNPLCLNWVIRGAIVLPGTNYNPNYNASNKKILLLTGICCSLTNCSTLFTGTSSDVQINSQPSGASSLRASQLGGYSSRAYGSDDIGIFGTPNLGSKPTAVIERDGYTSRI